MPRASASGSSKPSIAVAAGLFAVYAHGQDRLIALLGTFGWGTFAAALRRRAGQGKVLTIYQDRTMRDELVELSRERA